MVGWDSAVDVGQGWSTVGVERETLVVRMHDTLVRKGVAMVGKAMNLWMRRMHDSVEAVRQNTDHATHHNELWIHITVLNAIIMRKGNCTSRSFEHQCSLSLQVPLQCSRAPFSSDLPSTTGPTAGVPWSSALPPLSIFVESNVCHVLCDRPVVDD